MTGIRRAARALSTCQAVLRGALVTATLLCGPVSAETVHAPDSPGLPPGAKAGDLIFREGTEAVSAAVLSVDGGPYSHVGMLLGSPGQWQVIHATPAEVPGRDDGVVIDALAFYLAPARALAYAVFQVDADPAQRAAAVQAAHARLGAPFRLADPAGTYCTELVWAAWQAAGVDLDVRFTALALPLLAGDYLLPGELAASPRLQPLAAPARLLH